MNISKKEHLPLLVFSAVFAVIVLASVLSMSISFGTGGLYPPTSAENAGNATLPPPDSSAISAVLPTSPRVLQGTSDKGEGYIEKIIFVGDSTTHHLIARGVLPDGTETKQVWTPSNGTLMLSPTVTELKIVYPDTNEEITIAEAAGRKKPEYMVLTIGLNGSHTFTESIYKSSYGKLIEAIKEASPNTKIILQSVFPVAANESAWTSLTPAELNLRIDQVNAWAKDLTTEYDNVRYLDTQSVLRDEDAFLKASYESGDGIHLTREAYLAILKYIRTHAWEG